MSSHMHTFNGFGQQSILDIPNILGLKCMAFVEIQRRAYLLVGHAWHELKLELAPSGASLSPTAAFDSVNFRWKHVVRSSVVQTLVCLTTLSSSSRLPALRSRPTVAYDSMNFRPSGGSMSSEVPLYHYIGLSSNDLNLLELAPSGASLSPSCCFPVTSLGSS